MLKRSCMGILIFAIICSIILQGSSNVLGREDKVIADEKLDLIDDIFKSSGCEWLQMNVNSWAMLNDYDISIDRMKDIGLEAVKFFELDSDYDVFTNENSFMRQVNISGQSADGDMVNIIISNEITSKYQGEVYVVADIVSTDPKRLSIDIIAKQEKFFHSLNAKPQTSTTLTGTFSDEYNEEQKEKLCKEVFRKVGGKVTQSLKEDGLVSMAGYSPRLRYRLETEKGPVNLQVALRYSTYWGRTYIWLGTPIITTEY